MPSGQGVETKAGLSPPLLLAKKSQTKRYIYIYLKAGKKPPPAFNHKAAHKAPRPCALLPAQHRMRPSGHPFPHPGHPAPPPGRLGARFGEQQSRGAALSPPPAHPHPHSRFQEAPVPPRAVYLGTGRSRAAGRSGGCTEPTTSHLGCAPHMPPHCQGRCSHITPPGQAPPGRSLPPTGAVPGSAPLTHWQDFAAVCSEPAVWVSDESSAAAGQGQPGALGWGRCSAHTPPPPNKCDVEGAACGGSIPSCHGDAGCILGQSIAGSCVGAPTFLPAAVTGGCVWGQSRGTSLLLGTEQS